MYTERDEATSFEDKTMILKIRRQSLEIRRLNEGDLHCGRGSVLWKC